MKNDEFWSVELGVSLGSLVFGTDYDQLLRILRVVKGPMMITVGHYESRFPNSLSLTTVLVQKLRCTFARMYFASPSLEFANARSAIFRLLPIVRLGR